LDLKAPQGNHHTNQGGKYAKSKLLLGFNADPFSRSQLSYAAGELELNLGDKGTITTRVISIDGMIIPNTPSYEFSSGRIRYTLGRDA